MPKRKTARTMKRVSAALRLHMPDRSEAVQKNERTHADQRRDDIGQQYPAQRFETHDTTPLDQLPVGQPPEDHSDVTTGTARPSGVPTIYTLSKAPRKTDLTFPQAHLATANASRRPKDDRADTAIFLLLQGVGWPSAYLSCTRHSRVAQLFCPNENVATAQHPLSN